MTSNPLTPPDPTTIERLEAATVRHALTGVAPLGRDPEHNRLHLKNLVQNLEAALADLAGPQTAAGLAAEIASAAGHIRPLQRPGCCYVVTDGAAQENLVIPEPFAPELIHDQRFYVRPLIQAAATHGEFLLLTLSLGQVRAYVMSGEEMHPVTVADMPGSLEDVVGHDVAGATLQHHGTGDAQYHGQGKGRDDRDPEIRQFLRSVDQALTADVRAREQPLMLAAVDELAAAFRDLSGHRHLLSRSVSLSPDQTPEEVVRRRALDEFDAWRHADTARFLAQLDEHPDRAADDPRAIVPAAEDGRVDTLVAARDERLWGQYDPDSRQVELHRSREPHSRDLVDVAMRAAWRQGGRIRVVDAEGMSGPMRASLRY